MTHPLDKELDDYLRRDSAVSEGYRMLDKDDVPDALDAAVMAQAQAAVKTQQPTTRRKPALIRWGAPLALAASAVMIVAIVLEIGVQDQVRAPLPQVEQATLQENQLSTRAPQASEPTEAKAARDMVDRPIEALSSDTTPLATASPPPPESFAVAPQPEAMPAQAMPPFADVAPESPSASLQLPPSRNERAVRADSPALAGSAQRAAEEIVVTGSLRRAELQDSPVSIEPIVVTSEQRERQSSTDPSRPAFGPRAPGAPRAARAAAKETERDTDAAKARAYSTPERWLEAIRALRREGKVPEAEEQWKQFSKAYPGYQVAVDDLARPKP